jgi:beta-xylosidase
VENGWQVVLRSKNIYGPYEDKIVLEQGDTPVNGPHQGALVDTADDGWWFVHFQDAGVYGRVTHLQPVHWEHGWPVMGRQGEPVLRHAKPRIAAAQKISAPQTSDEFDGGKLGLQWQWHANHRDEWSSLAARPGWLRLFPQPATALVKNQPNLLLQKFPARAFTVETELELSAKQPGEEAGLIVTGESSATLGLQRTEGGHRVVLRIDGVEIVSREIAASHIRLRVEIQAGGACVFSYATDEVFVALPQIFQARKGVWIGAKVGLYSQKRPAGAEPGFAEFAYFRFDP